MVVWAVEPGPVRVHKFVHADVSDGDHVLAVAFVKKDLDGLLTTHPHFESR